MLAESTMYAPGPRVRPSLVSLATFETKMLSIEPSKTSYCPANVFSSFSFISNFKIGVKKRDGIAGIAKFLGFPNCNDGYNYGMDRIALPVVVNEAAWRDGDVDKANLLA